MSDFGGQTPMPAPQEPASGGGPSGPRAGFWRRFGATLIDGIILGAFYGLMYALLGANAAGLLNLVASYTYYTLLEGGSSGQTIGKKVLNIRVIDFRAGGPLGYGRAFLRNLARILSSIPLLLGYFWMLWDSEKQTWHDKLSTSVVVPVDAYRS